MARIRKTSPPAAFQTPPSCNTINEPLERRLRDGVPFATILRSFLDDPEAGTPRNVLIVTQLVPDATCHVAQIDASINRDANVLAREAADRLAGYFDCRRPAQIVGTSR